MIVLDCALLCLTCTVVPLAVFLPWPHDDRLVVEPQSVPKSEFPNVSAVLGLWRANASDVVPRLLNPARVAYFDERIRSALKPPFRVMDVGCGGGLLATELAGLPDYTVDCLDPSLEGLARAEAAAAEAGLRNVKTRFASVYFIPFEDHTFDAVILSGVLEHLLDLPSALLEVSRIIRPKGLLLFSGLDRSLQSFLFGLTWPEYVPRVLSRQPQDWRMLVRPEEVNLTLNVTGVFKGFTYEALSPSLGLMLQLAMVGAGALAPDAVAGSWSVGPVSLTTMFYIGHAVKALPVVRSPDRIDWQVGEIAEVRATSGPAKGQWVRVGILGNGSREETYRLLTGLGNVLPGVHVVSLRRLQQGDGWMRDYEPGELAEVTVNMNHTAWAQCIVLAREGNYTYKVRTGPQSRSNITAFDLRKVNVTISQYEAREWALVQWPFDADRHEDDYTECLVVRRAGDVPNMYAIHVPAAPRGSRDIPYIHAIRLRKADGFEVGEPALVRAGLRSRTWIRCTVTNKTMRGPNSPPLYGIHIKGRGDVGSMHYKMLRKLEFGLKFQVGDMVQVQAGVGPMKGSWLSGRVTSRSAELGTYDLRIPIRAAPGYTDAHGVAFEAVRSLNASTGGAAGTPKAAGAGAAEAAGARPAAAASGAGAGTRGKAEL